MKALWILTATVSMISVSGYGETSYSCQNSGQINRAVKTIVGEFAKKHEIKAAINVENLGPEWLSTNPLFYFDGKNRAGAPVTIYLTLTAAPGRFDSAEARCIVVDLYAVNHLNGATVANE